MVGLSDTAVGILIYFFIVWYNQLIMAISIKNLEVERLAREIADKTGESLTGAIQRALQERLDRLKRERRSQIVVGQLKEILRRVDQLPILDSRSPDQILGYDEEGLPR
jgi:antitoxin VapB